MSIFVKELKEPYTRWFNKRNARKGTIWMAIWRWVLPFSTLATNQLQAVQLSFFFFLPSILLSGFMFPFRGMPGWAQVIGEVLPITHFLRIARAVLLKGNSFSEIAPQLWQIILFASVALFIGVKRYRQTLD